MGYRVLYIQTKGIQLDINGDLTNTKIISIEIPRYS